MTSSHPAATPLLDTTARRLEHRLAETQARARVPSLAAGVVRDGELVWTSGRGVTVTTADLDAADPAPPTHDTQYKIGSVTKTMTAALVVLARERGLLALDDEVRRFLPDGPHPGATIRDLLSHRAGVSAEPAGAWWERTEQSTGADAATLAAAHHGSGPVLEPHAGFHYSNLGYGVLGAVAGAVFGAPWYDALRTHVLDPLGLSRTTYRQQQPHADGFAVRDLTGEVTVEPLPDTGAMAAAGQLWSTVADQARWLTALVDPDRSVLTAASLRAMATPHSGTPEDRDGDTLGLGLFVHHRGGRAIVGHGGSMPGFSCGVEIDRDSRVGAVLLTNAAWGVGPLVSRLLDDVLDAEPPLAPTWRPTRTVPDDVRDVVGIWHWGESPARLWWDGELLRLEPLRGPGRKVAFRAGDRPDTWVGVRGYFDGETLRAVRDGAGGRAGRVSHLECATFVYTRQPYDPAAPVPGGAPRPHGPG